MSFSIQNLISQGQNPLQFEGDGESQETVEDFDSSVSSSGFLKSGCRKIFFKPSQNFPPIIEKALIRLGFFTKTTPAEIKPPFMNKSASPISHSDQHLQESQVKISHSKLQGIQPKETSSSSRLAQGAAKEIDPKANLRTENGQTASQPLISTKSPPLSPKKIYLGETGRHEKTEKRHDKETSSLHQHRWVKEETAEWWESRYHQKERQGGNQQDRDQQDQQDQKGKPSKAIKGAFHASKKESLPSNWERADENPRKPHLTAPKMGVFALYYILTKIGIYSDGISNFSYKKEIEIVDNEASEIHKKRLDELKASIQKEQESVRWGIAYKVFSWLGSIIGIITGIALIASGVGAVAGAMIIIGGLIQVTNQILEVTGGWKKITELLPGDDSEKKGAIATWMQIGIAVLCLILSGAGAIWGGYSHFTEAMTMAMTTIGAVASMAQGITTIGQGITLYLFYNRMSDIKYEELRLARLKHHRKDLMEKVEEGVDRLEKLFEDLARALEFEEELFFADQLLYRR